MPRVAVIGAGKIGYRIIWELAGLGYDVSVADARSEAVDRVSRELGVDGIVADATSVSSLKRAVTGADIVVSALPGSIGYRALELLMDMGADIVDISFYREDPSVLSPKAEKEGITVVVDAGVAPGLSNMLVGYSDRSLEGLKGARIFVGGVSRDPQAPLGLALTWSLEDLIDEYLRPARMIKNGRLVTVDPLAITGRINVPGLGVMEFFPTDGLRSLIKTYKGVEELVEYTLRWPGHVAAMKSFRGIGLMNEDHMAIKGCVVRPRDFLAKLIERNIASSEDLVVLLVEAWGRRGRVLHKSIVEPRDRWTAMARATAGFAVAAVKAIADGILRGPGIVYPEMLGSDDRVREAILAYLRDKGVSVHTSWGEELIFHISEKPLPSGFLP
ncbi:MAG: saccharopine dehydrogenase NADP-binding domain-containing protein [Desulfurococcales archaeon]|nr:saccharopine dehydrogenase NADP-binding domain-containing protein [Desulfurococcales archaeon]